VERLFERWYPFCGGAIVGLLYFFVPTLNSYVFPETTPQLLSAVVSVGGISLGFLMTAKAILISVDDRPFIQRIKEARLYKRIIRYMRSAIFWSFALTLLSAVALIFDYKGHTTWDAPHVWATAIWFAIATAAILSYIRVSRIWYAILDMLDAPAP
jgi:hypothetical protein